MADDSTEKTEEIYINGFFVGLKAQDLQLYTDLHGQPIVNINMSLITAKNLAKKLTAQIEHYEKTLGVIIDDYDELQAKIDAFNAKLKEDNKKAE